MIKNKEIKATNLTPLVLDIQNFDPKFLKEMRKDNKNVT